MNVEKQSSEEQKSKLPFAVFVCSKTNDDEVQDYKQIFTDIISDRIKEDYES